MRVFMLILAMVLIEIGLFVTLGGALGLWLTLAFVLGSTGLGVFILRRGPGTLRHVGGLRQLVGSGFSVIAALLLILPGFLTSFLGLLLLIPTVQRGVVLLVGQRLVGRVFMVHQGRTRDKGVIDGEFTEVEAPRDTTQSPSKWTRH